MNVKVLGFVCFILMLDGVLSGKIFKRDVNTKTDDDEDVYGELGDTNIQKDQDYYDGEGPELPPEDPEEDARGSDNEVDVKLVSKPETFVENLDSVVLLPCQASSTDVVKVWVKDTTLLYQGTINVQNKKNLKLFPNGSLEVTMKSESDYGKYSCKLAISETSQPEVVHKIVKKTKATIVHLYSNFNKTNVLNVGDELKLTCQATGYPKPKISWHRNNERLGTEGEILTIQPIRPKHAGSYRCLADNKVGEPAHKHIDIYVNHAPMVSVEKYIVNSDHKSDVEFVCEVKAYPVPVVNWQKDGENLFNQEPKIKLVREKHNERNILIIKDINEDDFGAYSCVANNALGRQVKNVTLVRTPALIHFEKSSNETTKDVILEWKVQSKQTITMHELQYRKKGEQNWKVVTPEVTEGENDVYLIKHVLRNLEPGVYETRARSKNNHGWSDYSEIMPFEGAKHHHQKAKHTKKEQKELKTPDPTHDTPAQHRSEEIVPIGESTSSSTSLRSPIFLVSLTLFATYFHIRQ